MAAAVSALEVGSNGVTIRATQPKAFYENNQKHMLNEREYTVVLTKKELKEAPDKSLCVATFITDMSYLFHRDSAFNDNISTWDTSQVIDMGSMFSYASSFNGDISRWDTSKVVDMGHMFDGATSFNSDISNWNVEKLENMKWIFNNTPSFKYNTNKWNLASIRNRSSRHRMECDSDSN